MHEGVCRPFSAHKQTIAKTSLTSDTKIRPAIALQTSLECEHGYGHPDWAGWTYSKMHILPPTKQADIGLRQQVLTQDMWLYVAYCMSIGPGSVAGSCMLSSFLLGAWSLALTSACLVQRAMRLCLCGAKCARAIRQAETKALACFLQDCLLKGDPLNPEVDASASEMHQRDPSQDQNANFVRHMLLCFSHSNKPPAYLAQYLFEPIPLVAHLRGIWRVHVQLSAHDSDRHQLKWSAMPDWD